MATASVADAGHFEASLGCLFASSVDALAARLARIAGLHRREQAVVVEAVRDSLTVVLHGKLARLLVLELNAARLTGRLQGEDGTQRWQAFLELSSDPAFWAGLSEHYPSLHRRVAAVVGNRCAAAYEFAARWAADRPQLDALCGGAPGLLGGLEFGAGDSHCSGRTVALARAEAGTVVYKPRAPDADRALAAFVCELAAEHPGGSSIRVPTAIAGDGYGWTAFIEHRYAADDAELQAFYRGVGHWLAIMRLLGGTDLHAENLIAAGPSPVVIDCETLFTPRVAPHASGLGEAVDRAAGLVGGTVLNIGLLPGRGMGLGWRGVDTSAVGALPDQQPMLSQPQIVGAGSDEAHIGTASVEAPVALNHPSPRPELARFWPQVIEAFDGMTATLQRRDAEGRLEPALARFRGCRVRVVPRATEVYAQVARMLWHPASLHGEAPAVERARELLRKMAANVSTAPDEPAVIDAEVAELLDGDVPYFSTCTDDGRLQGPRGTCWREPGDLVEAALRDWRDADLQLERNVIQAALVSAYINDGWMPDDASMWPARPRRDELDARRRRQASRIVDGLAATAIHGSDGTVTWIAPVLSPETGWSIQPLSTDLYGGLSGVSLLLAAYLREMRAGRADPVDQLEPLLQATLRTLAAAEARLARQRGERFRVRALPPGGYHGLGSQIWTLLQLHDWGLDGGDGLERACALAEWMPEAVEQTDQDDVLSGLAGAIPSLLELAGRSGEGRYRRMAAEIGDRLCAQARRDGDRAHWPHAQWPHGVGGFAHGVSGIGWALAQLARNGGDAGHAEVARAAFAFEDALYDETEGNWTDLRRLHGLKTAAAWCHGSVGIGLARLDLDRGLHEASTRHVLRRAAAATWRFGMGWNHCTCHGDLSAWELLDAAVRAGEGPDELDADALLAGVLGSLETHGPTCGMTRDTFSPGLMPGVGGIAYQLLRAHPDSGLPSILTPGCKPA